MSGREVEVGGAFPVFRRPSAPVYCERKRKVKWGRPGTEARCTACHDYGHPSPPTLPFLLAQKISSKRTDNMWPKSADVYMSSVVKGLTRS